MRNKLHILFALLVLVCSAILIKNVNSTNAYFSDGKVLSSNTFSTGQWGTTSSPIPTPTPHVPHVCFFRFMWVGSIFSNLDKWIELKNMTDTPIDICRWTIENTWGSGNKTIHFSDGNDIIPANGSLVISQNKIKDFNLLNLGNGDLKLKDDNGNIVDQATSGIWSADFLNGTSSGGRRFIERNSNIGDGLHSADWHDGVDSTDENN